MAEFYAQTTTFLLTAMAQTPQTLFVCWDAEALANDKLTGKIGANVRAIVGWGLRISGDDEVRDFVITPAIGKYYVHQLCGGKTYKISLFAQDTMREKHTIVICGEVTMPQNKIADDANATISAELLRELCGGEVDDGGGIFSWSE